MYTRVILSETYQSLHRLSANRMKLCGFVGLVNVSIAVDLKIFKNLAKRSKSGAQVGVSQSKIDFWNFSILNDRKLKLLEQILFNKSIILLSGNIFVRRSLCIKIFPQKSTFLGFWKLNFSDKKQDLINDFICIRIVCESTIQL